MEALALLPLLILAVIAYYRWVLPTLAELRKLAQLPPEAAPAQLQAEHRRVVVVVTVILVLVALVLLGLEEAVARGAERAAARWYLLAGTSAVLGALWSPWGVLRIGAMVALLAASAAALLACLLILAGGPDSRGGHLPSPGPLAIAALFFLLPFLLLLRAEYLLWRLERSKPKDPPTAV